MGKEVPIVESTTDVAHKPFAMTDSLRNLHPTDNDATIMQNLNEKKDAFANKIQQLNDKLDKAYDSERYEDPGVLGFARYALDWGLDMEEYNLVVSETESKLGQMEAQFNDAISGKFGKGSLVIMAAMDALNSNLDYFLSSTLKKVIATADSVDADQEAFAHKMNPQPTETVVADATTPNKESWGEAQANKSMSAIARHKQELNDAMNAH